MFCSGACGPGLPDGHALSEVPEVRRRLHPTRPQIPANSSEERQHDRGLT